MVVEYLIKNSRGELAALIKVGEDFVSVDFGGVAVVYYFDTDTAHVLTEFGDLTLCRKDIDALLDMIERILRSGSYEVCEVVDVGGEVV